MGNHRGRAQGISFEDHDPSIRKPLQRYCWLKGPQYPASFMSVMRVGMSPNNTTNGGRHDDFVSSPWRRTDEPSTDFRSCSRLRPEAGAPSQGIRSRFCGTGLPSISAVAVEQEPSISSPCRPTDTDRAVQIRRPPARKGQHAWHLEDVPGCDNRPAQMTNPEVRHPHRPR